jgi:glycosyltransferase involved in cell wall biosynthesis
MKVAYILPYDWGGMPHYTAELANGVSKYADVTVIGSEGINSSYFSKDVHIIKVFRKVDFSIDRIIKSLSLTNLINLASYKDIKVLKELDPDVIHLTTPLIPPLPFFIHANEIDKIYPIIYTKHGIFSGSGLKMKLIEEFILNNCEKFVHINKVIVHTKNDKDALLKIRNLDKGQVAIIPHGAYTFFKEYGKILNSERNTLLFFGNIREYKGLRYLLEAVPRISLEIPDLKVIIAGKGDLSQFSNIINDEYRFEVYNDFISDDLVSEIFQRAEIVVLPYTQMSGQSGIINIAFAFGKPIVATDVCGLNEAVENNVTGLLVPPNNSELLAKAIIKLLKNEKMRAKMGNNVLKKASELSWNNIAKRHLVIYNDVLNTRKE